MPSKYTNTKRIRDEPTKLQIFAKRALYAGAAILFCAAVYTVLTATKSETNEVIEKKLPYGSLEELSDPKAFLAAYLLANCDKELLESTQTIHVTGTIEGLKSKQDFQLMKKRPHFMRLSLEQPNFKLTIGVIDDFVWQRIQIASRPESVTQVEGAEADAWRTQGRFYDRIISTHLGVGKILSVEPTDWNGQESLKVLTEDPTGKRVYILVDPRSMYPIAEQETLPNGQLKETIMSDYQIIDGMPLPFVIESFIDGTLESRMVLDTAKLNTGLLSRLFEAPQPLVQQ